MSRMSGVVGYGQVASLLRQTSDGAVSTDWMRRRSHSATADAGTADLSLIANGGFEQVRAWLNDDCPKWPGNDYARFFAELDAWSEYWDIFHPETHGRFYFGDETHEGYLSAFLPSPTCSRNAVFDSWKTMVLYAGSNCDQEYRERFEAAVRQPKVAEAVLAVDELVLRIVRSHFAQGADGIDAFAYLDAMERFGKDTLPANPERYECIPIHDSRKSSALHHTIEGDIMWFGWSVHLECATLVAPPDAATRDLRALMMAGIALGCSFDFAFRKRCRTRREYVSADSAASERIWARARQCSLDFEEAAREVRTLFRIRQFGDE